MEALQIESVAEFIERRQLSWWGHINRVKECRQVRQGCRRQEKEEHQEKHWTKPSNKQRNNMERGKKTYTE